MNKKNNVDKKCSLYLWEKPKKKRARKSKKISSDLSNN